MKKPMIPLLMLSMAAITTAAIAEPISYLDIQTSTGYSSNVSIDGIDIGGGNNYYGDQTTSDSFTIVTNMVGDSNIPVLGGNIQVANASSSDIDFVIGFYMPVTQQDAGSYDWAGSISLALTGIDASLSSLIDTPVWSVGIDDIELGTLLSDPFEMGFSGTGSQSTQEAISSLIDWNGDSGMLSIGLSFNLSAGDTAVFGTSLGFIPTPGAICLLAITMIRRAQSTTIRLPGIARTVGTKPGSKTPDSIFASSRVPIWPTCFSDGDITRSSRQGCPGQSRLEGQA